MTPCSLSRLLPSLIAVLIFGIGGSITHAQPPTATPSPKPTNGAPSQSPTPAPGQIDCNASKEVAKQCLETIASTLESLRESAEDYVALLKKEKKEAAALKTGYAKAKADVDTVITLLKKKNPNFTQITIALNSVKKSSEAFETEAAKTLNTPPTGVGFLDKLVGIFLNNVCRVMPNPLAVEACTYIKTEVEKILLARRLTWREWSKVPAFPSQG